MRFRVGTDYKTEFNNAVTALVAQKIADRQKRMAVIEALINEYMVASGEIPEQLQLERLTNAILMEELSDSHPDKMTINDCPIMSDYQLARRQFGAHREKSDNVRIEVPIEYAMNVGTDGRDYRYPSRRKRTIDELIFIDEHAKSRNDERNKIYRDFTKGHMVDGSRVFSNGVFSVDVATGIKTVHDVEKYKELVPWAGFY